MRLFMRGDVEKSLRDFDEGLEDYFSTSRKYRSSLRRGSVVLLDGGDGLFKFLTFLADRCGLDVGVVHVKESKSAKNAIEDLDPFNVKALVMDSSMVGESMNGDSITSWLAAEHPRIPVWVVNCESSKGDWIRSQTSKVGVIDKSVTMAILAKTIGFPDECQQFVAEYAS